MLGFLCCFSCSTVYRGVSYVVIGNSADISDCYFLDCYSSEAASAIHASGNDFILKVVFCGFVNCSSGIQRGGAVCAMSIKRFDMIRCCMNNCFASFAPSYCSIGTLVSNINSTIEGAQYIQTKLSVHGSVPGGSTLIQVCDNNVTKLNTLSETASFYISLELSSTVSVNIKYNHAYRNDGYGVFGLYRSVVNPTFTHCCIVNNTVRNGFLQCHTSPNSKMDNIVFYKNGKKPLYWVFSGSYQSLDINNCIFDFILDDNEFTMYSAVNCQHNISNPSLLSIQQYPHECHEYTVTKTMRIYKLKYVVLFNQLALI